MNIRLNKYFLLLIPAISGFCLHGFLGGMISGACLAILIAVLVGKKAIDQTTRLIDKKIMDAIINLENEKLYAEYPTSTKSGQPQQ